LAFVLSTANRFLRDHGEGFDDHGGFGHGHSLYDELTTAPLMLSLPGVLPLNARPARQVRRIEVAPEKADGLDPPEQMLFTTLFGTSQTWYVRPAFAPNRTGPG